MLAFIFLGLGVASRLIVHEPNFSAVIALALFGSTYLNRRLALILPVFMMGITDCILGFHGTMPFTWVSIALIAGIGILLRKNHSWFNVLFAATGSAVLFFIITNFGAWLELYPHSLGGLKLCYMMAIPFFKNSLVSTLFYSAIIFAMYEITAWGVRKTPWAAVLLAA